MTTDSAYKQYRRADDESWVRDAIEAANERYPQFTRHAEAQRRAYVEGWIAAVERREASSD